MCVIKARAVGVLSNTRYVHLPKLITVSNSMTKKMKLGVGELEWPRKLFHSSIGEINIYK